MKKFILLFTFFGITLSSCSSDDTQTQLVETGEGLLVVKNGESQIIISRYNHETESFDILTQDSNQPTASVTVGDSIRITSRISDPYDYDIIYEIIFNDNPNEPKFGSGSLVNWGKIDFIVSK